MPTVPAISTHRLDLVALPPEALDATLEGDLRPLEALLGARPDEEWLAAAPLRMRREQLRRDPSEQEWLVRAIVLREPDRAVAGHIGFHAPPGPDRWVEVGYAVLTGFRRRGIAEEAVRGLLRWAARERGIRRFRASVGPWNAASLGLVRKLGFAQVGTQWDEEDGEELVFERDAPPPD